MVFELVAIGVHEAVDEVGQRAASVPTESQQVRELDRAVDEPPLEIGAPIAEVRDALHAVQPLLATAQAIEGLVEEARDIANLVRARGSDSDLEIAAADLLGGRLELADRAQEVPRRQPCDEESDRERDEACERPVTAGCCECRKLRGQGGW